MAGGVEGEQVAQRQRGRQRVGGGLVGLGEEEQVEERARRERRREECRRLE